MSLVYSDTSTLKGIIQQLEKEVGFNEGDISDSTTKLKEFTADINIAFDEFTQLALESSGTWQWDDSNQTDYPIITTNLVDGQRDYSFTVDGSSNLILDIYKVFVKSSSSGSYQEVYPIDVQSDPNAMGFTDGQNIEGAPVYYDKTSNGIFLDPIPSTNVTSGLKVYINREASYFVYTDTTKKPGIPGIFHEYLPISAAYRYACRNLSPLEASLYRRKAKMEEDIKAYFGRRERDVRKQLTMAPINFR